MTNTHELLFAIFFYRSHINQNVHSVTIKNGFRMFRTMSTYHFYCPSYTGFLKIVVCTAFQDGSQMFQYLKVKNRSNNICLHVGTVLARYNMHQDGL